MPLSKGRVHYGIGDLITVQSLGRGLVIDVSLNEVCHEESVRPRRYLKRVKVAIQRMKMAFDTVSHSYL